MNPWKDETPSHDWQGFCNAISAWIEVMLKDEYPGAQPTVWFQKTHSSVLVELPPEIKDPTAYMGMHRYSKFLKNRPFDDRAAYIYPYNSARGSPEDNGWKEEFPNYNKIPPRIFALFAQPYPIPEQAPAPPFEIEWARPIPLNVYGRLAARQAAATPPCASASPTLDSRQASTSSPTPGPSSVHRPQENLARDESRRRSPVACARDDGKGKSREMAAPTSRASDTTAAVGLDRFTPYNPPSHYTSQLKQSLNLTRNAAISGGMVKLNKMDPYEEDEAAEKLLRSFSPVKPEPGVGDSRLIAPMPSVKQEDQTPLAPEEYKPSVELLELLATLQPPGPARQTSFSQMEEEVKPIIKPEPVEVEVPAEAEYHASEELLSLLESLPPEIRGIGPAGVSVKDEPREVKIEPETVRIKEEAMDSSWSARSTIQSVTPATKPELSRDPRIRARALAAANANSRPEKRDGVHVRETSEIQPKRIKKEHDWPPTPQTMHYCLQVPEILDIIFQYVVPERSTHSSRLVLLPLTSLVPLFKTLPDELVMEHPETGYNRTFNIGPLKLENVVRLESYARRIRCLRYLPYPWHSSHREGPHDLEVLKTFARARQKQCRPGPVFPNLFQLEFIDPAHAIHALPIFLESKSISLSLHWSESEDTKLLQLFPVIRQHATHMHELDLGSFKDNAGLECEKLSSLVSKMTSLRALACGSRKLTSKALASLVLQPHLSKLQIPNSSQDFLKAVKGDAEDFLSSLHHLRIVEDNLPSFAQLLDKMRPIELQTLAIACIGTPKAMDLAGVLKTLEERSNGNLREFTIKQVPKNRYGVVTPDKTVVIDSTTLQPLLAFKDLTTVSIALRCTFLLLDADLTSMAKAWPRLQHLQLGAMQGWGIDTNVTFVGLLSLLRLCPDLRYLVLPFDARAHEQLDSSAIAPECTNTKITYLNVSNAPVPFLMTHPVDREFGVNKRNDKLAKVIARVLLRVLPNLCGIGGSWLYHGGETGTVAEMGWLLVGHALTQERVATI
ncbi:hypothetical protein NLJ89_g3785 [Agrocybe chaxingu]|uniref:Uncharacterized protein n=1 Tax=Agrocybe chaxingu TaxID=84603 RepID=A0A9W8K1U3_9AGAR|nr:hypothetical protein NLJ89_g3785 [Agrocybe chaxingu]